MNIYLRYSYDTGRHLAFEKIGLTRLPQLGAGERGMLEDPDMPEDIRQTELDSFLHRAITSPVSSEQDFMESGKLKGTVGGGALGGGIGASTGFGIAKALGKKPGLPSLIGGLGAGSLGALIGRPLGAESGRREHKEQSQRQDALGDIYTDPFRMQRELQRHLQSGRRKRDAQGRAHEMNVAMAPSTNLNYNVNE